jgi:hypothetical protein
MGAGVGGAVSAGGAGAGGAVGAGTGGASASFALLLSAGVADNFLHCKFTFYQVKLWGYVALHPPYMLPKVSLAGALAVAAKCVACFCGWPAKAALFTAKMATALPAFVTQADASWVRLLAASK